MSRKNRRMQEHADAVTLGANNLDAMKAEWDRQDRKRRREDAIWIAVIFVGSIAAIGAFLIGVGVWS